MGDPTLEANWFTAYVPRFPVIDRLTHLAECVWSLAKSACSVLCGSKPASLPAGLRPPGNVPSSQASIEENKPLNCCRAIRLKSAETRGDLPMLHPGEADAALKYWEAKARGHTADHLASEGVLQDAFTVIPDIPGSTNPHHLLPPEVRDSTLLNSTSKNSPGKISSRYVNQLVDKSTGFAAAISYDSARREVIIGFPGMSSQGLLSRQQMRCFLQWLGFVPKNISQASKLTRLVKDHLEKINALLPENEKITLTLSGHSMGGALASYAALRNKVPAVVFNPMRLSHGPRARIGQTRLDDASKYITEVVIQGDWLSDNRLSWIYAPLRLLGIKSFGPLGTARRFMVPHASFSADPHNDVATSLRALTFYQTHLSPTTAHIAGNPQKEKIEDAILVRQDFAPLLEAILPGSIEPFSRARIIDKLKTTLTDFITEQYRPDTGESEETWSDRFKVLQERYSDNATLLFGLMKSYPDQKALEAFYYNFLSLHNLLECNEGDSAGSRSPQLRAAPKVPANGEGNTAGSRTPQFGRSTHLLAEEVPDELPDVPRDI